MVLHYRASCDNCKRVSGWHDSINDAMLEEFHTNVCGGRDWYPKIESQNF